MATLTYREAVARGIAQEMARDERVLLIGEDVAEARVYHRRPLPLRQGMVHHGVNGLVIEDVIGHGQQELARIVPHREAASLLQPRRAHLGRLVCCNR